MPEPEPAILDPLTAPPRALEEPLYEVIQGVRVELTPMGMQAVDGATELVVQLRIHLRTDRRGRAVQEGLFILRRDPDTRRRPDVAYVSAERWPLSQPLPTGDWDVIPDLAVEFVSPHDTSYAVANKIDEYFAVGVREVWVVLPPRREATVYTLDRNPRTVTARERLDTPLLPGFATTVAALFETPEPE